MKNLNIAIVGCGAMVELLHLPAINSLDGCRITALVDQDKPRAERLAMTYEVPNVLVDYRELPNLGIDAAVVALPNYLHAPVSIELLASGIHVFVEKPMALSKAECDAMIMTAKRGHALLAVGLHMRQSHGDRFAKWAIENDLLGNIKSFESRFGFVFAWPVASDAILRKDLTGGGVLMDLGPHILDQLLWLLGDVESFHYFDDNFGGVEADCKLNLIFKSGAHGTVELSRTRDLSNSTILRGDRAELEILLQQNSFFLRSPDGSLNIKGDIEFQGAPTNSNHRIPDLVAAEHEDFFNAIRLGRPPSVSGEEGKKSVELIEACYADRRPLKLPWVASPAKPFVGESDDI